jgi:hypothetical protein
MRSVRRLIDLAGHIAELQSAAAEGRAIPAGRLYGLPELPDGDYWVDTAGASALTGAAPKTITAWLTRGGPARHPFPTPERFLYRLYWRWTEVESWLAEQAARASAMSRSRRSM